MKTKILENLDDNYINLYESGIFIKSIEYSAILLSELFWYKIVPYVDKKTFKVYLESWFPISKKEEVLSKLKSIWYSFRYIDKSSFTDIFDGTKKIDKDKSKLINIKKEKIIFE